MCPRFAHPRDFSLVKRVVAKPISIDGIILESWAQGFMVGALIILSCITLANMRRGVLLHKLILLEVSSQRSNSESIPLRPRVLTVPTLTVNPRHMAGLLAILSLPNRRLVALSGRHPSHHVMVSPQRYRLDEDQSFSSPVC
jgi:hypothetical protein